LQVIPGAEAFYFKGNAIGCLLVHGFTGSPSEMRLMGEYLADKGFTVLGVRLEGHGTSPEDMIHTEYRNWYTSVEHGLARLRQECDKIFVMGLSMGGILSLYLASNHAVDGVVSLSAPIFINNRKLPLLPIYRMFKTYEPKPRKPLPVDPKYNISYDRTPLRCVSSLLELINLVKVRLKDITAPVLIIQSRSERTVKPESAEYIYRNLTAAIDKKLFWLYGSGHIVTLDKERDVVFAEVLKFIQKHSEPERQKDEY
jgi:carboxylesterase